MQQIDKCVVRIMNSGDLTDVLAWRNHLNIRHYMINQHKISMAEHVSWFERKSADISSKLTIVEEHGSPIGFAQFNNVAIGGISEWGFYTVPGSAKGSGRKLGHAALHFAFETILLHKVCGSALSHNEASIGFHKTLGFRQEGLQRDQYKIGNDYFDLHCFGLLASDWRGKKYD